MTLSDSAAHLKAIYEARDAEAFAHILCDDVFWGDPEYPQEPDACHSAEEVLTHYQGMIEQGVSATVTEILTELNMVALGLLISWPPEFENNAPRTHYQIFRFRDDRIDLICGTEDREKAVDMMRVWSQRKL